MTGQMHILDRSGHTTLAWDTETNNKDVNNGPLDQAYVEAEFERLVKTEGFLAFGTSATGESEQLKSFNKEFPKITLSPQFVGG